MKFRFLMALFAFALTVSAQDLAITEVAEGNGGNFKYVEITNYGTTSVNLDTADVELHRFTNASMTVSGTIDLTGILNPGDFLVVANNDTDFMGVFGFSADINDTGIQHNGNDSYQLIGDASGAANVLDSFAGDLIGDSSDFAENVIAFRIKSAFFPGGNNGIWGSTTQPSDGNNSASGFWTVFNITSNNANAASIGTPGADGGATNAELPVELESFSID